MTVPASYAHVCCIIPAWNEEGSVGVVVQALKQAGVGYVIVANNKSTDNTAAVAEAAGATVVLVSQRGYGSACLGALAHLPADCTAILFCDADGADDLNKLPALVDPILHDQADLVVGSRALGKRAKGALSWPQLVGNTVCSAMMRVLYRKTVSDLGPFRCVSRSCFDSIAMSDPNFGWTAEMQVKVFKYNYRYLEVAVDAHCRIAGESKISGKFFVGLQAGWIIIRTILHHAWSKPAQEVAV